ncbi:Spaetzle [Popillia japonica]|uniref:Spaetzle n=1 Tax=Popillia japonica TaxID=7064 RepID=A0AAW1J0W0_POPJA
MLLNELHVTFIRARPWQLMKTTIRILTETEDRILLYSPTNPTRSPRTHTRTQSPRSTLDGSKLHGRLLRRRAGLSGRSRQTINQ